jgi:GNAT superfamily N-acetyltransferase
MPESPAFWLMTTGLQLADCVTQAPHGRARIDDGGWLALSGENSADLNMGCILDGPEAASLLGTYVAEADGLPAILMVENLTAELLEQGQHLGAQHVGAVPTMVWHQDHVEGAGTGACNVHPASSPQEAESAIALIAEAFSLDLDMCRNALAPAQDNPAATIWLGIRGSERVGAGVTVATGDIVGVYCMATPERQQRQGFGRAVLRGMMSHHLAQGATRFNLGATEAGIHLYEQMGYEVVATPAALIIGSSTQFH